MVKSMFAAVAGLRAHQTKMDTIGNNIANVNTYGFKCTRALFKDQYYATINAASDATEVYGGGNPSQMGYGSVVNSVDRNFGRGGIATTDHATDVLIDGDGFFLIGEMSKNGYLPTSFKPGTDPANPSPTDGLNTITSLNMTRLGDFGFDENGHLVNGNKKYVYGYRNYAPIGEEVNFNKPLKEDGTLNIDNTGAIPDDAKRFSVLETIKIPDVIMDANGSPLKIGDSYAVIQKDANGNYVPAQGGDSAAGEPSYEITTNPDGTATIKITKPDGNGGEIETTGYLAPMVLHNIAIGEDGSITGTNDLNQNVVVGKIGLASVPNSSALEAVGSSEFRANGNTGVITGVDPGSGGTGLLSSSKLEMSNVDLALEFTEMITTQRGYQANTRIITVTDEMLQELVNIKR